MSNRRNTARPQRSASRPRHKAWQPYLRLPPFLPVPTRTRRDGWTPGRQARFIALLARTGCVRDAAQALGLSRESAYRLRRHPGAGSFRAAWDTALTGEPQPRWKFTREERRVLATLGAFTVHLFRGQGALIARKTCTASIFAELRGLAALLARRPALPPATLSGGAAHSAAFVPTSGAGLTP